MKIISIDPGKKGAIVFFKGGKVTGIMDTPQEPWGSKQTVPSVNKVRLLIAAYGPARIILERVGSNPTNGRGSLANFMLGYGILIGCCSGYSVEYLTPQLWKNYTGLTGKIKSASVAKAILKCPEAEPFIVGFKNKVDRSDAVLIGYSWLKLKGEVSK